MKIAELESKRVAIVCTTAGLAEYVSKELYAQYKVEHILNQSKI